MKSVESKKKLWEDWQRALDCQSYESFAKEKEHLLMNDKSDEKLFNQRIKIGTGGIRELIGCGFSLINHASVFAITSGLLKIFKDTCPQQLAQHGVIVGYDGRRLSKELATLVAGIFSGDEFVGKVRLFSKVVPTPTLAYGSRKYGCALGVMITASHNRKEYNGYKIYDCNGCFVRSPTETEITACINEFVDSADEKSVDGVVASGWKSKTYEDPYDAVKQSFLTDILAQCSTLPTVDVKDSLSICYTAMQGTGQDFVVPLLEQANFKCLTSVKEQAQPDENFSTVDDPNPELGAKTLGFACDKAQQMGSQILLANDPDADRLAVAERGADGQWKYFTGNQVAMLLVDHLLKSKSAEEVSKCCIFYSTVSSMFPKTLNKQINFEVAETLTGFKYLGEAMRNAEEAESKIPLLAFEESIGYLVGTHVYDKDGVSAALVISEIAEVCYKRGETLATYLRSLMERYGYHVTFNNYCKVNDMSLVPKVFDSIRYCQPGREKTSLDSYPKSLCDGKYTVVGIRDLTIGFDSTQPNNEPVLPVSKSNQMITFYLKENLILTVRGSGTEPKIKLYTEKVFDGDIFSKSTFKCEEELVEDMRKDARKIIDELLKPDTFDLVRNF